MEYSETRKIIYEDYSCYSEWRRILCFHVEIENSGEDVETWIVENLKYKWGCKKNIIIGIHTTYYFENYKDAVAFKLRWG